jgi:hypothetical protein
MTGIGTGIRGIASSASYYNQLSGDLTNDIEQMVRSIVTMQDQLDSLASVVLPPKSERVRLTHCPEVGTLSLSKWRCCFYMNQSGIVRDMAQQL